MSDCFVGQDFRMFWYLHIFKFLHDYQSCLQIVLRSFVVLGSRPKECIRVFEVKYFVVLEDNPFLSSYGHLICLLTDSSLTLE